MTSTVTTNTENNHNNDSAYVKIKDHITHLSILAVCDKLFEYIESLNIQRIIVDFDGFDIASRSFVHQYLIRKESIINNKNNNKIMEEINMSKMVKRMFIIVEKQMNEKSRIIPVAIDKP